MKKLTILSIALLIAIGSWAQNDSTNHMFGLKQLIGQWEGSGWMRMPDGKRVEFNQTEDIYSKLEGQLLVINGLGRDASTDEKIFEAFGVINYSQQENVYKFNAYTNDGRHTLANFEVTPDGFNWWFDTGNGTVKYKAKVTSDTWVEEGFYSPDEENWYPFFKMELEKKS